MVPPAFTFRQAFRIMGCQQVLLLALTGVPDLLYDGNHHPFRSDRPRRGPQSGFHRLSCCLAPPAALWKGSGYLVLHWSFDVLELYLRARGCQGARKTSHEKIVPKRTIAQILPKSSLFLHLTVTFHHFSRQSKKSLIYVLFFYNTNSG